MAIEKKQKVGFNNKSSDRYLFSSFKSGAMWKILPANSVKI